MLTTSIKNYPHVFSLNTFLLLRAKQKYHILNQKTELNFILLIQLSTYEFFVN